jgi:nucleoid-associated protein EbfC
MKSIEEMMKAAQDAAQTIQKQMEEAQGKLDSIEVEGVSGGGLVKVRASAKGRIIGLAIDDSLIVPADKQILEDLVVAAFNAKRPMPPATPKWARCRVGCRCRPVSNCRFEALFPSFSWHFDAIPLNAGKRCSYST